MNRNYIIKFANGTFYSRNKSWGGVEENKATWLTHSDARLIASKLNQPRIAMRAIVLKRIGTIVAHHNQ